MPFANSARLQHLLIVLWLIVWSVFGLEKGTGYCNRLRYMDATRDGESVGSVFGRGLPKTVKAVVVHGFDLTELYWAFLLPTVETISTLMAELHSICMTTERSRRNSLLWQKEDYVFGVLNSHKTPDLPVSGCNQRCMILLACLNLTYSVVGLSDVFRFDGSYALRIALLDHQRLS